MLIKNFVNFINSKGGIYPNIILDIGSRDLDQSLEFNSIYPNAKIYAFEANPSQYEICKSRSQHNENIEVIHMAVSDKVGFLDFYKTLGNIGASSLLEPIDVPFASTQDVEKIQVPADTLKNWIDRTKNYNVDIMWMDVQGIELLALKGMESYLDRVKFIHCEASIQPYYKNHILKNDLEDYLINKGFDIEFHPVNHPYGEGDIFCYKP